jgi:hypothetical protein
MSRSAGRAQPGYRPLRRSMSDGSSPIYKNYTLAQGIMSSVAGVALALLLPDVWPRSAVCSCARLRWLLDQWRSNQSGRHHPTGNASANHHGVDCITVRPDHCADQRLSAVPPFSGSMRHRLKRDSQHGSLHRPSEASHGRCETSLLALLVTGHSTHKCSRLYGSRSVVGLWGLHS